MEKSDMHMVDVLPAKWRGTLAVLFFGIATGGGGSTAMWSFGPGASLAEKVETTRDGFTRLTEQVTRLTEMMDRLERRQNLADEGASKRLDGMARIESDVRLINATSASYKAEIDGRLNQLDRAIEKLNEKLDRANGNGPK